MSENHVPTTPPSLKRDPDPGAWSGDHRTPRPDAAPGAGAVGERGRSAGGATFAGVLMMIGGALGILNGISGIARDNIYTRVGAYVYALSLSSWGWIHLLVGVAVTTVGYGILKGASWSRTAGIVVAALYVIAYFLFLPYAPVWSVIGIAIGVFVIWALASEGPKRADAWP
ncbi:hypothetical protein [Streptomyces sp. NPDC046821]|uniref:DUF7144 family membrane protein n=1 Tax=Streptomyces sp. NPDC046821 TaxID=3154702 RepID=UPI0033EC89FD